MISETFFASNYISIWRTIAPTMDDFVRKTNMDGYTRVWPPLSSYTLAGRRGLINEAGFVLFAKAAKQDKEPDTYWASSEIGPSFDEARARTRSTSDSSIEETQNADEEKEALEIFGRLYIHFIRNSSNNVTVAPAFSGCGIVNNCFGDVIINDRKIVEIKSGDRSFRSIDYRQVSIYCALHYAKTKNLFEHVELLNPRTGICVEMEFSQFVYEISGNSPVEFCQNMIENFIARFNSN